MKNWSGQRGTLYKAIRGTELSLQDLEGSLRERGIDIEALKEKKRIEENEKKRIATINKSSEESLNNMNKNDFIKNIKKFDANFLSKAFLSLKTIKATDLPRVAMLQQALKLLNYTPNSSDKPLIVDGYLTSRTLFESGKDSNTQIAIREFRKEYGLSESRVADTKMLSTLSGALKMHEMSISSRVDLHNAIKNITVFDKNEPYHIMLVQKLLSLNVIDGNISSIPKDKIKSIQSSFNKRRGAITLVEDGILGSNTFNVMKDMLKSIV
jgi:hypothetical protein